MDHSSHGGAMPPKPKVPPEMAAFLSARLGQEDLPEFDQALAQENEASGMGALTQNLSRAASLYRGERVGPVSVPKDNALRDFVLRKQAEAASHQPEPMAAPEDDISSDVTRAAQDAILATPAGQAIGEQRIRQLTAKQLKPYTPMYRATGDLRPPGQQKASEGAPDDVDRAELTKRGIPAALAKTHGEALDLIGRHDAAKAQRDARATTAGEKDKGDATRQKRELTTAGIDLRKEFQALPVVKDMQNVATTYEKISTASPNGPGDISMIFAFMKMIDPGSTVREGEFATAENSGGVPAKYLNTYNKLLRGDKLPPNIRTEFRREAKALYDAQRKRYDAAAGQYRRLATQAGLAPDDVVLDVFGATGGEGAPSGAAAGQGPARIASDAEYDALPSGAQFVDPEGKLRRKP